METLTRVFKALADPNRLRILNLLLQEPLCVCEMERILKLSQPLLSRHLAYLRNAGLVQDRRLGARVQYSIDPDPAHSSLRAYLRELLRIRETYRRDILRWKGEMGSYCPPGENGAEVPEVPVIQGESR